MLIDGPLASVLARVDAGAMERATSILSPVLLLCGLGLYAHRVSQAYAAQHPPKSRPPQAKPATQTGAAEWGQRLEPVRPEQVAKPESKTVFTPEARG